MAHSNVKRTNEMSNAKLVSYAGLSLRSQFMVSSDLRYPASCREMPQSKLVP